MTQVDRTEGLVGNTAIKAPCKLAATVNVASLSGSLTIDGVATVTGDRILLTAQTSGVNNGIWVADSGAWSRALDCDGDLDITFGTLVRVTSGSANYGFYICTTATDPIIVGTTSIAFSLTQITVPVLSSFMATVLDDVDSAAARATLGVANYISAGDPVWGITGNGVTNDASAIQTMLNASGGKTVYFPEATYYIGASVISIPGNQRVVGDNPYTTQFKRDTDTNLPMVQIKGQGFVYIENIGCLYTAATGTLGYAQSGFSIRDGATDVLLRNCVVQGFINRGFHIINSSRVTLRDCVAIGNKNAGIRIVSDFAANAYPNFSDETSPKIVRDILVTGCHVYGGATAVSTTALTDYGINAAAETGASDDMNYVRITDCHVYYTKSQGISVSGKTSRGSVIANNTITNVNDGAGNGVGILVQRYNGNSASRWAITGNVVKECVIGMWVQDAFYGTITGNVSEKNTSHGLYIAASGAFVFGVVVTGNLLTFNGASGAYMSGAVQRINITGNDLEDNTNFGVYDEAAADRILITSNMIRGNGVGPTSLAATNSITANNLST